MSRDRSGYNGLRPIGGHQVPLVGQRQPTEEQIKQAIMQEVLGLTREIYVRSVSSMLGSRDWEGDCAAPTTDELHALAEASHRSAKGFFEGLGIIQFGEDKPPQADSEPAQPAE